jgi:hypothetical protein
MIHKHHRVLGDRSDNRAVNILLVDDEVHRWIHANPAEAMELGWIVSKHDDPENVSVRIPKAIVAQPEKKPRQKKASTPEERKARKNFTIGTPKDEENVIPELVEAAREAWAEELGWSSTVPSYFVVVAAFAKALQ